MKLNPVLAILLLLPASAANSQTIPWSGGPVIQNARVITIYWGEPDPHFSASIDRFYSQITGTSYLGRLLEYSTTAFNPSGDAFRSWFGGRTEQLIGTGALAGSYVLGRSEVGYPRNISMFDVGPMLDHEIHVHNLPAPDKNTVYMVHFAPGWTVFDEPNILGTPPANGGNYRGQLFYCASHFAYYSPSTGRAIVFAAIPYQASLGSCVNGRTPVDAETIVASDELVKTITDPGSFVTFGDFWKSNSHADEAWHIYTSYLGFDPYEIPDVCEGQSTRIITSPDPRDNYLVSKIWSNSLSKCVGLQPVGNFDNIVKDNVGNSHVRGWTLDPENPNMQIQAHVYFDGPYPYGKGFAITASLPRPDVNSGTGYPGTHGFDFVVPAEFRDGKAHAIYVYGIGITSGNNALLSSVPLVYNSSLSTQSPTEPVMIASAQAPGQCMDITGVSTNPGAAIQLYQCLGGDNQRFSYHADTQELRAYNNSYLCLDASGGAGNNGDRLIIWPCNGEANQKWTFNLVNGEIRGVNDKCLDANAGSVANGTAVQIWACNTGKNQSWFRK